MDEIELDVPATHKGWEVTPNFTPATLDMSVICDFQPGKDIPKISLGMEWLSEKPAKPTDVVIKVLGIEKLKLPCGKASVRPLPESPAPGRDSSSPDPSCLIAIIRLLRPRNQQTQRSGRINLDRDLIRTRDVLRDLNNEQLRNIGRRLGLSNNTVNNCFDSSTDSYCSEMLTAWMSERDDVTECGGATWENLRRALQDEGLNGHAARIQLYL